MKFTKRHVDIPRLGSNLNSPATTSRERQQRYRCRAGTAVRTFVNELLVGDAERTTLEPTGKGRHGERCRCVCPGTVKMIARTTASNHRLAF